MGIAFGQSVSASAQAIAVLKARDGIPDWNQLQRLIEQWRPDVFVVGLPFNMDGSDSELLRQAMKFAGRLHGRFHLPVYGMDERLSSRAASEQFSDAGKATNKADIDHIAARIILENWLSELDTLHYQKR